jgi:tetratricopeptide (TPR) repeat protein
MPPTTETQHELLDYSAVQLFLQSARRADAGFDPSADDLKSIAQICRLVQGMPLGILLAAGWAELLSPSEIAAEINQSLDFLETDLHDLPDRQRSMRAVFDHSWNLLGARQRALMQAVSVFRGEFSRQAAQEVADASLHDLLALANRSLLYRTQAGRYEVHELLRQYAAEKLEQLPTIRDTVRDRHSAYYTATLRRLESDLKGAGQQAAMAQIDQQLEDVRAAWDWAMERGHVEQIDRATESLALFFRWRSRQQEGQAFFQQAAERLSALLFRSAAPSGPGPVVTPSAAQGSRVLARLWAWQYRLGGWLDEPEGRVLQRSLDLLERAELAGQDTRPEKAFVLQQMAYSITSRDPEQAEALCWQSLALYQALEDRYGMAEALDVLGMIASHVKAYDQARELYEESLVLRQLQEDRKGSARSLMWLSEVAVRQGQVEESARLAQDSIAMCREIGDQGGVVLGLNSLCATLGLLGRFAEAQALLEGSPAMLNNLGFNTGYAHGLLGWIKTQLGRYDEARLLGRTMRDLAQKMGFPAHIGLSYWVLGCVALAAEAYVEAQGLLREGVAIFREIGRQDLTSWALVSLGYAARGLGQLPQAREQVREALQVAAEIGFSQTPLTPVLVAPALALFLADEGEQERAVELYALVSRHPFVAHSRWLEDIAGKHIAAVARTLPPEVVTAAQERGRARDLQTTVTGLLQELAAQA